MLRGVYIAVIDTDTNTLDEAQGFDTGYDSDEYERLLEYIRNIDFGKTVLVGMTGKATTHFDSNIIDSL